MRRIVIVSACTASAVLGFGIAHLIEAQHEAALSAPDRYVSATSNAQAAPLLTEIEQTTSNFERSKLIYDRVANLPIAEIESLSYATLSSNRSPARAVLIAALLERWVEIDATGAEQFFGKQIAKTEVAYRQWFSAWYQAWLEVDYRQALRHALALTEIEQRDQALQIAMTWAGEGSLSDRLFTELSADARVAVSKSRAQRLTPEAAFTDSLRYADPDQRFELMRNAFARLLQTNSSQAFMQLEHVPSEEREAIASAVAQWAGDQPDQAWQQLNRDDLLPTYRAAILGAVAERDPQRALEWLRQENSRGIDARPNVELYRATLPALLKADLNNAAQAVAELRGNAPMDLIQQVAVEFAKQSPQAMYAWANGLSHRSEFEKALALRAVSASLAATDIDVAQSYLQRSDDPIVRDHLLREIANRKAQTHVRDGWEWLSRYRDDAAYRENARALLSQWSVAKPAEVGDVVRSIPDAEFQRALAEQLAAVWRERDEAAFKTWAESLSPGLRATLLRESGS